MNKGILLIFLVSQIFLMGCHHIICKDMEYFDVKVKEAESKLDIVISNISDENILIGIPDLEGIEYLVEFEEMNQLKQIYNARLLDIYGSDYRILQGAHGKKYFTPDSCICFSIPFKNINIDKIKKVEITIKFIPFSKFKDISNPEDFEKQLNLYERTYKIFKISHPNGAETGKGLEPEKKVSESTPMGNNSR